MSLLSGTPTLTDLENLQFGILRVINPADASANLALITAGTETVDHYADDVLLPQAGGHQYSRGCGCRFNVRCDGIIRRADDMTMENVMFAVAFVVILGTAGYYLRRAVRVLPRARNVSLLQFARGWVRMTLPKTRGGRGDRSRRSGAEPLDHKSQEGGRSQRR